MNDGGRARPPPADELVPRTEIRREQKEPDVDDFPLLNLFLLMIWFFFWAAWIAVLVSIVGDVFRSPDLTGRTKALWTLFLIVLPWLGVVVYLIARGDKMHERYAN
jgi:hypothetical protein